MIFELIAILILLFVIVGLVYQFMPNIWLWVFIGALVFYAAYLGITLYFHSRKKAPLQEVQPMYRSPAAEVPREEKPVSPVMPEQKSTDPEVEKLREFVQKNLKMGFKQKTIRDALVKQGWPKEKVELAFK